MTAEDLVIQALGRVGGLTNTYPSARGPMYVRIGYRQRQLFAEAAKINPERYGTCASANLQTVSGHRAADLNDIASPVPTPETIQRVEIDNKGTSTYTVGDLVAIVTPEDRDAEFAPRAYLRDGLIIGVSTDLDLVTSVKVWYPRLPDLFLATDSAKNLDLVAPWDTLLEIDLAKWLVTKATQLSQEIRAAAVAAFEAEEKPLLADFLAHVAEYTPCVSRFAPPRVHTRR